MLPSARRIVVLALVAQMISSLVYLFGFFPVKQSISFDEDSIANSTVSMSASSCSHSSIFESRDRPARLVLIVIDAWRASFLLDPQSGGLANDMPFLARMIREKRAHAFIAKAQTPTVTLPRIKALVTGTIPAFIDLLFNFASSEIQEDNLIDQFLKSGTFRKAIFYGDDTWLRLFPGRFARSEGTTSFFVSDYTENLIKVDDNVTRHLDRELKHSSDWHLMILHYLGLDHIGHSHGARSPLIPRKLAEMDGLISRIFSALQQLDNDHFVVTVVGDHGMSELGSHGGASGPETLVPMVLLSPTFRNGGVHHSSQVEQVDLVPTLASIFGLPIPVASLGLALGEVLAEGFNGPQMVDAVRGNALQITRVYKTNARGTSADVLVEFDGLESTFAVLRDRFCNGGSMDENELDKTAVRYRHLIAEVRSQLIGSLTQYNEALLLVGIFTSVAASLLLLASQLSSSGVYFGDLASQLLLVVSYFSSSFIEEEHQTRYFIWTTMVLVLTYECYLQIRGLSQSDCSFSGPLLNGFALLAIFRVLRSWNQTGNKWAHMADISDWLNRSNFEHIRLFATMLSLRVIYFCVGSICRGRAAKFALLAGLMLLFFAHVEKSDVIASSYFGTFLSTARLFAPLLLYSMALCCAVLGSFWRPNEHWIVLSLTFVCCLVAKTQNLPVIAGIFACERLLWQLVSSLQATEPDNSTRTWLKSGLSFGFFYCWLASTAFFLLGNSNSVGTIDVAAGYVGISSYMPLVNGALILLNTYTGPLLIFGMFHVRLLRDAQPDQTFSDRNSNRSQGNNNSGGIIDRYLALLLPLAVTQSLALSSILCVTYCLRYHLFVWSVFAPKLLYESVQLNLLFVGLLISVAIKF